MPPNQMEAATTWAASEPTATSISSQPGSQWLVPQNMYPPLKQDAILVTRAQNNPAAKALLDYLKTPAAREVIQSLGYDLPPP